MKSSWITLGLKSKDKCPYRKRREHTEARPRGDARESGGMRPHAQGRLGHQEREEEERIVP